MLLAVSGLGTSATPETNPVMPRNSAPNVVFVITDDQGYGDLGSSGNPVLKTPHLDRFHDDAIRLTDFHVGPTCAPTRAGLLTGKYSGATGVWHTIGGRSIVRESIRMLPDMLRGGGYRTAMFGKWHLGDNFPYRPQDRGFETVVHHPAGGIGQQPDYWGNDYFDDVYFVNGEPTQFEGYCTDVWFDEAKRYIQSHVEEHPERPFFCYLAPNAPHGPYNVPEKYFARYRGLVPDHVARFYGMIDNLDENFADLRKLLADLGIDDNTIVVFMTDNGSSCPMVDRQTGQPQPGYNAGLRGGKGSAYDGGHRVPVFVRWPAGNLTGGRDVDALTANIDMTPTLLDLCGVSTPDGLDFDGQTLRALLEGENENELDRVVVTDSQRVIEPIKWRDSCVMTTKWRLIRGEELYDIQADRSQLHDVAEAHPEVVARLRAEYEAWWDHVYADSEISIPLALGDSEGPATVQLNSHDWRYPEAQGDVVWNQGQVRRGDHKTGYWEVDVKQPGRYQVEMRRWPREDREHPAASEGTEAEPLVWNRLETDPGQHWFYEGDTPLILRAAKLSVGQIEMEQGIDPGTGLSIFEIDLDAGETRLRAEFTLESGESLGAYYVYVSLLQIDH